MGDPGLPDLPSPKKISSTEAKNSGKLNHQFHLRSFGVKHLTKNTKKKWEGCFFLPKNCGSKQRQPECGRGNNILLERSMLGSNPLQPQPSPLSLPRPNLGPKPQPQPHTAAGHCLPESLTAAGALEASCSGFRGSSQEAATSR